MSELHLHSIVVLSVLPLLNVCMVQACPVEVDGNVQIALQCTNRIAIAAVLVNAHDNMA